MRLQGSIREILYPSRCLGCRVLNKGLCSKCLLQWKFSNIESTVEGVRVYSSLRYNSVASHILLAAKEDGIREADELLVAALNNSLRNLLNAGISGSVLVPIPSAAHANRKRGRRFMHEIGVMVGEAESLPVWGLIEHQRKVADQTQLNPAQRERNVSGAMRIRGTGKWGRGIILLDDLVTTGATLSEAVKTMKAQGTPVAGAITAFLAHPIR